MYDLAAKTPRISVLTFWQRDAVQTLTAEEVQRRYLTPVLNYVAARIGAGPEAEDVTAEVFAAAFAARRRFPIPSDPGDDPARAWLFGVARRKLADLYRRRERRQEINLSADLAAPTAEGPEPSFLACEAANKLRAILAGMPELQAEALRLKYVEELSLTEIGIVINKKPGAVAQLLHRARANARQRGAGYFGADFAEEGTPHEL